MTDTVEKLSDEQRVGNNRIQVPRSLNQCCAPDSYLESMLLIRLSKNVFRQHRSGADPAAGNSVRLLCASSRHPRFPRRSFRWRSRRHAHHGRVADNTRPVPPNESPESLLPGVPMQTALRVGTVNLARRQTLYQSELKTLAAPTLVVLHFPVHAFHAGKSFQLALACSK